MSTNIDIEKEIKNALKGREIPILVLDKRWHTLFPEGEKPSDILAMEKNINELLKKQARLVTDLKDLKKTKKRLMASIVQNMQDDSKKGDKKKTNSKRLLDDINVRIDKETDELMDLPYSIRKQNEQMLIAGAKYCFNRLSEGDSQIKLLNNEIDKLKSELDEKLEKKKVIEESMDSAYSLMHGLLGPTVMNLYK